MPLFQHAAFYITANSLRDLPAEGGVEIAFAGRSNAGKSSAINTLANRKRLAFVSKTPGRTQCINYFSLGDERYLVDLPGYGYARVPPEMRQHWEKLLSAYLQMRQSLRGLVLVMDIRHPLTPLDRQMLDWFAVTDKPVHILLTKADKLTRNQADAVLRKVRAELAVAYPHCSAQTFSSAAKSGVEEVEEVVGDWLREVG
ncbi:MAG: ribosome biogenesis GTP-binding protein YihA/YsxC [Pseudomonadota bacterium]